MGAGVPTEWDYSKVPGYEPLLGGQIAAVLAQLRRGEVDTRAVAKDTRATHGVFFAGLTPAGHDYFAGNYRGAKHPGLRRYRVKLALRDGADPVRVAFLMSRFADDLEQQLTAVDHLFGDASVPEDQKVAQLAYATAAYFIDFLKIHPYANGNGHVARYLAWMFFSRYGYWPETWTVEPRPAPDVYAELIIKAEQGDLGPLAEHLLACLL